MCHSLEAFNYLKLEVGNFLSFNCAHRHAKIIGVDQEYAKGKDAEGYEETHLENLYNVKLPSISLLEISSIFSL